MEKFFKNFIYIYKHFVVFAEIYRTSIFVWIFVQKRITDDAEQKNRRTRRRKEGQYECKRSYINTGRLQQLYDCC